MDRTLQRCRDERMVFGVCAGLAHYFDLDATLTRLIFVLLAFASGVGILAYIILAIVMPEESIEQAEPGLTVSGDVARPGEGVAAAAPRSEPPQLGHVHQHHGQRSLGALILILIGLLFLMNNLGLFWWLDWGRTWPVLLIAIGLFILLKRRR